MCEMHTQLMSKAVHTYMYTPIRYTRTPPSLPKLPCIVLRCDALVGDCRVHDRDAKYYANGEDAYEMRLTFNKDKKKEDEKKKGKGKESEQ